jgi:hypothetical protein
LVAVLFLFDTAFSGLSILLLLLFFIPVALGNSMFGFLNLNVISWLSHVVIERPSINFGNRLSAWLSAYPAGLKTGVVVPDITPRSAVDRA